MIHVNHAKMQIPGGRQFVKGMQQEHGIGSAGNRNSDALAGQEHPVTFNSLAHRSIEDIMIKSHQP